MTLNEIIINDRIRYIYEQCRAVGITHHGAIGLLGNLKGETSDFDPMSLETMYANRFGLSDAEYTRRADAGEKIYGSYCFEKDNAGYGIAQWTWWERKKNLFDYAKSRGTSVGNLETQVHFMFREMQVRYTNTWKVLTTTDDYRKAVEICVNEYEKPANAYAAIQTRCAYAKEFLETISGIDAGTSENVTEEQAVTAIVAWAYEQLGYMEKRSNAQLWDNTANAGSGNYTKYAAEIDEKYPHFYNGAKNGFAWCDVFVDNGFITVFGYDKALALLCTKEKSSGAGCIYSAGYYRAKGQLHKTPKVGDQIFFGATGSEYHTGIVVGVSDTTVTTIEGNTSDEYGVVDNGGMVCKKQYPVGHYSISGYGRPDYSLVEKIYYNTTVEDKLVVDEPVVDEPTKEHMPEPTYWPPRMVSEGMSGPDVVALQGLLIAHDYAAGITGIFDNATKLKVMAYQGEHGFEIDGIAGPITWASLTKI